MIWLFRKTSMFPGAHAYLRYEKGGLLIIDRNSRNGYPVNEKKPERYWLRSYFGRPYPCRRFDT